MLGFGNLLFELLVNGDILFHGDTLDVHVSLAAVITPITIIALALIIGLIQKDKTLASTRPLGKKEPFSRLDYFISAPYTGLGICHGRTAWHY